MAKPYRIPSLAPLKSNADAQFEKLQRRRHHSDIELTEQGWADMQYLRRKYGIAKRSQVVNAAISYLADQARAGLVKTA